MEYELGSQAHREQLRKTNIRLYGEFLPHVKKFVITELDDRGYEVAVVKHLNYLQHEGDAIWEARWLGWVSSSKGESKRFHWRPYDERRDL